MSDKSQHTQENKKPANSRQQSSLLFDIMNGNVFKKASFLSHLPFFFFIGFLGLIYIGNRFHAEKIAIETAKIQKEIKDLRSESVELSSEFTNMSNQNFILKKIEEKNLNLIQSKTPPIKLNIGKDE